MLTSNCGCLPGDYVCQDLIKVSLQTHRTHQPRWCKHFFISSLDKLSVPAGPCQTDVGRPLRKENFPLWQYTETCTDFHWAKATRTEVPYIFVWSVAMVSLTSTRIFKLVPKLLQVFRVKIYVYTVCLDLLYIHIYLYIFFLYLCIHICILYIYSI